MARSLFFILLFPFLTSSAENLPTSGTLLWRVSGNGLLSPSYLYGTMHTRDKRAFHFSDSVLVCFTNCSRFAMELKVDEINSEEVLSNMMLDSGQSVEDFLTAAQFDSLKTKIESSTGLPANLFVRMKPVFIATLLSGGDVLKDSTDKNSNLFFLDEYFEQMAKKSGMKVDALEQVQTQLNVFNSLTMSQQIDFMMNYVRSDAQPETLDTFIDHYINGDISVLLEGEEFEMLSKDFVSHILYNRNKGMADQVERMAREQSTFAAFGAAHLCGDSGVISLLRKKGYTVDPVFPSYNNQTEEGWNYVYPESTIGFAMPGLIFPEPDTIRLTNKTEVTNKIKYVRWFSQGINRYCIVPGYLGTGKNSLSEIMKEAGFGNNSLSKIKNPFTTRRDVRAYKMKPTSGYLFVVENGNETAVAIVYNPDILNHDEIKKFLSVIRLKVSSIAY